MIYIMSKLSRNVKYAPMTKWFWLLLGIVHPQHLGCHVVMWEEPMWKCYKKYLWHLGYSNGPRRYGTIWHPTTFVVTS
jgi:hypothetical protein